MQEDIYREEREEALRSAVDHVDFVEADGVDDLLALLKLPFWARHELGLRARGVVVPGPGE